MNKQALLNTFLIDLCKFVEKYYSSSIESISNKTEDGFIEIVILGKHGSNCEISSDAEEITIIFGETHWHIDNYSEPCDISKIYENTINNVVEIISGNLASFSCWIGDKTIGGSSFSIKESDIYEAAAHYFITAKKAKIRVWNHKLNEVDL